MKHLKVFEDFYDSTPSQANNLLKKIEKEISYNLKFGSLHKAGYVREQSNIIDDDGPLDWLKIDLSHQQEKEETRWHLIFMINEEMLSKEDTPLEKVFVQIQKYKLPEYKKVNELKEMMKLEDVMQDDYILKKMKEVDKQTLKVPDNEEDYKKNINQQIEDVKNMVKRTPPQTTPAAAEPNQ